MIRKRPTHTNPLSSEITRCVKSRPDHSWYDTVRIRKTIIQSEDSIWVQEPEFGSLPECPG